MAGIEYNAPTLGRLSGAAINFNSTGDNTVVAGVASQTVRVFKIFFLVDASTTVTFKRGGTALTGAIALSTGGGFVLDFDAEPWFVTGASEAFVINQSGTAQVSGRVYYTQS